MSLDVKLPEQILKAQQRSSLVGELFVLELWFQFRRIRQRHCKSEVGCVLTLIRPVAFARRIILFQSSNQIGVQIRAKLTSVTGAGYIQRGSNRKNPDVPIEIDAGLRQKCDRDEADQGRNGHESKKHAGNDSIFRNTSKDYT